MPNAVDDKGDAIIASVLLVDDHVPNLIALEAALAPLRHRLVRATSGAEALLQSSREDFALVLLDAHMPDLDGFATAALLRKRERSRNTPIIFLTAVYGDDAHAFAGYKHGAVDYIAKPFHPEMLRAKVEVFTELYAERERLRRQADVLRARERFIGILGHDLRSPLGSILMGASMLAGRTDLPATSRATAERMARTSERMARMVQDLLDFTQIRSGGGIPTSPRPMDLATVCRRVVSEELEVMHPDRTVLFSAEGDSSGSWDPDRVEQVVTNLVTNALEHGAYDAPVRIDVRDEGSTVALDVHNEGAPIPAQLVPLMFDPFRRGTDSSAARRPKGLGLGLYIVKQIAQAHGGRVDVSSTAAGGTTFTVRWPRGRGTP